MRRQAKMVNFGLIYGMSAFGLAQRLAIPRAEAGAIIEQYFAQFPGVKGYIDRTIAVARENGYVETMTGRRRYLRDINSRNGTIRMAAERVAINMPIQGTAADMIKIAMIRIAAALKESGLASKLVLQVHDELLLDVVKSEAGPGATHCRDPHGRCPSTQGPRGGGHGPRPDVARSALMVPTASGRPKRV